ncbi:MAG TPA: hypothetical protein PLF41_04080, partial [Anaerolineales bacterium]|nr:hypothetical protein [Anaerolineales bacterium]
HLDKLLVCIANEGFHTERVSFEEWRADLFKKVAFMENGGWEPYLPLIEEVEEKQIFMPRIDLSNTLTKLAGTGIECAPVNGQLLSTYIKAFIAHDLIQRPEIKTQ